MVVMCELPFFCQLPQRLASWVLLGWMWMRMCPTLLSRYTQPARRLHVHLGMRLEFEWVCNTGSEAGTMSIRRTSLEHQLHAVSFPLCSRWQYATCRMSRLSPLSHSPSHSHWMPTTLTLPSTSMGTIGNLPCSCHFALLRGQRSFTWALTSSREHG